MSDIQGPPPTEAQVAELCQAAGPIARRLAIQRDRLKAWVGDLQSGMYVNCVYCGHRYGPNEDTPVAMADVLKEHIEQCPEHPLSHAKAEIGRLQDRLRAATGGCRMLSEGDGCGCGLCKRDREIARLQDLCLYAVGALGANRALLIPSDGKEIDALAEAASIARKRRIASEATA